MLVQENKLNVAKYKLNDIDMKKSKDYPKYPLISQNGKKGGRK